MEGVGSGFFIGPGLLVAPFSYSTRRKVTWIVAGVWVMAGIAAFGFVVGL